MFESVIDVGNRFDTGQGDTPRRDRQKTAFDSSWQKSPF